MIRQTQMMRKSSPQLCRRGVAVPIGGTEDEVIAGLLHDAVEDQGGIDRLNDIRNKFGNEVARIVEGCTAWPDLSWKARRQAYIDHIRTSADASVSLVSACDKLHNARCILRDYGELGEAVWNCFNASKEEILWYYRGLVEAFRVGGFNNSLVTELTATVTAIEHLAAAAGATVFTGDTK